LFETDWSRCSVGTRALWLIAERHRLLWESIVQDYVFTTDDTMLYRFGIPDAVTVRVTSTEAVTFPVVFRWAVRSMNALGSSAVSFKSALFDCFSETRDILVLTVLLSSVKLDKRIGQLSVLDVPVRDSRWSLENSPMLTRAQSCYQSNCFWVCDYLVTLLSHSGRISTYCSFER